MHRPTRLRTRLRTPSLTLGALVALFGAGAGYAQTTPPAPEPCAAEPADEVSSSRVTLDDGTTRQEHLALFDVYWDYDDDALDPNSKTLINNPCPPLARHIPAEYDERGDLVKAAYTARTASDVNIGHTIIHIPSSELQRAAKGDTPAVRSFKRTVTASGTGAYNGVHYAFLRPKQADGTRAASADVWIVPGCEAGETPTRNDDLDPPLCLGFSAGLLQLNDWVAAPDAETGEGATVQYEFEAIREPGHATQGGGWGDFYVFHVNDNGTPKIIWRTDDADSNVYKITPGTYDHAFWAFTKPGTYVFHVHVKGHPNSVPGVGFNPISTAETVTSEVRRYTFHVGDLTVNHDPIFEVERSVTENSNAGTNVGAPLCVKDPEDNTACFTLYGHGAHENFTINGSTNADKCGTLTAVNRGTDGRLCAQIQVKAGAALYDGTWLDEDTNFYDLTLQVSDGKDPESNKDPALHKHIDDSIAVVIDVTNDGQAPLTLVAPGSDTAGGRVELAVSAPTGVSISEYTWVQRKNDVIQKLTGSGSTIIVSSSVVGSVEYAVRGSYYDTTARVTKTLESVWKTVRWEEAD